MAPTQSLCQRWARWNPKWPKSSWNLPFPLPGAYPHQVLVASEPVDQHPGRLDLINRLGHEGSSQRCPVLKRSPHHAGPMAQKCLQPHHLKHRYKLPLPFAQRPKSPSNHGNKFPWMPSQYIDRVFSNDIVRGPFLSVGSRQIQIIPERAADVSETSRASGKPGAFPEFCNFLKG